MTKFLPDNHLFLSAETDINGVMGPFMQKHDLSYFQYVRVYHEDNSLVSLVNKGSFIQAIYNDLKIRTTSHYNEDHQESRAYSFLWQDAFSPESISFARENFGMFEGVGFIERRKDYYLMAGFSANAKRRYAHEFYLNNIGLLKDQIRMFEDRCAKLIAQGYMSRLIHPEDQSDVNKDAMKVEEVKIKLSYNDMIREVTQRECDCLILLAQGQTLKEIGSKLSISPRTVETHLNHVKIKFSLVYKSDLIRLAHQNQVQTRYCLSVI